MIKFETINEAGKRLADLIQKELKDDASINAIVFMGLWASVLED